MQKFQQAETFLRKAGEHRTVWTACSLVLPLWYLLFVPGNAVLGASPAPEVIAVEGQPLAANASRLLQGWELLGRPLPSPTAAFLETAIRERNARRIQELLDPWTLFVVSLNPESRVKVARGPATPLLQQGGYTPVLVKVINYSTTTQRLKIFSPQGGAVYSGESLSSLTRQRQTRLRSDSPLPHSTPAEAGKFLALEMFAAPPLGDELSGLEVQYLIALIYSQEAGKREATVAFDVGQGNQDLGFRGETAVLFQIRPAVRVHLKIREADGQPTVGRLLIRDSQGHVYPPQAKRLAPDFFFQPHIYRQDGEELLLPAGEYSVTAGRGPEYRELTSRRMVSDRGDTVWDISLERWVQPADFGFYSGDHHIHAAGCAHYTLPTEGVLPRDMFRQVKGEGLHIGCVLTWGPCYRYQRQFFAPKPHGISERHCLLKYDLEISGFGSQALGHVCLLNLRDQNYPGSDGTETKGWPTWPTPALQWCRAQGGVGGYAHSASGLAIDAPQAAARIFSLYDNNRDGELNPEEASAALLPESPRMSDGDRDGNISLEELRLSHERAADRLPNLAIPAMNGVGAMELPVSVAENACDFMSAMDTPRIAEWNMWYHILNCGFPLKISGETDFPCMSSRCVGTGRVYVRLGKRATLDYEAWCRGLAAGKSYVSDGYAHALEFSVNQKVPGDGAVELPAAESVAVAALVAFARETPRAVATGSLTPAQGQRVLGDTVVLYGERREAWLSGGMRQVEVVVNGEPVAAAQVPADGRPHKLSWKIPVRRSSWIALRHFPELHTNPVDVLVAQRPIRAAASSARWCREAIELLWKNRHLVIDAAERPAARAAYDRALARYRQIEAEARP